MTSAPKCLSVAPDSGERKGDWPVAGARVHPTNLRLIDVARAYTGESRSAFMAEAAVTKARRVLVEREPGMLEHFPAA